MPGGQGVERRHRDRRRKQQVVAPHELAHVRAKVATPQVQPLHVERTQAFTEPRLGAKVGVGHGLLLRRQRVPQGPCADEPQPGDDLQRVFDAGVDLLDARAQRLKLARGGVHRSGNFGVHVLRIAERRRVGDREAAHAVVQAHREVGAIGRQRGPVARVGTLDRVHHQRGVAHAHGVRPDVRDRAERRQRIRRHAPEARLQAEVTAERRRDAHAAGAVGAHCQRSHPRRHGRGRAAR